MQEWWSISDLLVLQHPALPSSLRAIRRLAEERLWASDKNRCREVSGKGGRDGKRLEYHYSLLPPSVQNTILVGAMIDEFRKFIAQEIMRHNTRKDRNTQTAKGRSFAEVFQESLERPGVVVRKATALQRQFFLLAGEAKPPAAPMAKSIWPETAIGARI